MPEITEERLAYLEALEALAKEVIGPFAERGLEIADAEYESRFAREWSDEEVKEAMCGSALWDDRPKGWRTTKLLTYSRGELAGRGLVGGNLGQYFSKIARAVEDPVGYWHSWRLGFLEIFGQGNPCLDQECSGTYVLDEERMGIVCCQCSAFLSYREVQQIVNAQGKGE